NSVTNSSVSLASSTNSASLVSRGADRSAGFLAEPNISSGPLHTYRAATNSFTPPINTNQFLDGARLAVNRNGSLFALQKGSSISVMNASLAPVITLSGSDVGIAFDPLRDLLYAASSTGVVSVYDTNSWAQIGTLTIGDTLSASLPFPGDAMIVSDDGRWLFVQSGKGVAPQRLV